MLPVSAQEQEPPPFSPIVIQGNPNVGLPEPHAVSDIAINVGLRLWK